MRFEVLDTVEGPVGSRLVNFILASAFFALLVPANAAEFDVAHVRRGGKDFIIIPRQSSFGYKPASQRSEIIYFLQSCASRAGLAGTVVPVWAMAA